MKPQDGGIPIAANMPDAKDDHLVVTEIYASLQGETTFTGLPFVLVRLARCNLRCVWCDSEFTFKGGTRRTVTSVVSETIGHSLRHVLVTGGEPLLQPAVYPLMAALLDAGREVLLETGGSLSVASVDPRVVRVVDVKCPASGESAANLWSNLPLLTARDQVKFVVADRADYEYARDVIRAQSLAERVGAVLISPVSCNLDLAREVAKWLVLDRLPARLQLQMHKILWNAEERGR